MYWEYDSRIGRRWNVDPVLKVWESPYLCFSGNPIWFSDIKGDNGNPPASKPPTNIKIGNLPVFMGEVNSPSTAKVALKYANTAAGKLHSKAYNIPGIGKITLIAVSVEKDKYRRERNRTASVAANPGKTGDGKNTQGHEFPYASTEQGGALSVREIITAKENRDHGQYIKDFYKDNNLKTGDKYIVALFEPEPVDKSPKDETNVNAGYLAGSSSINVLNSNQVQQNTSAKVVPMKPSTGGRGAIRAGGASGGLPILDIIGLVFQGWRQLAEHESQLKNRPDRSHQHMFF